MTNTTFSVGETIHLKGKYKVQIVARLSSRRTAGMSTVYLAQRTDKPDLIVVLKVAKTAQQKNALEREVSCLQKLHRPVPHPHIIRLNYGEDKALPGDAIFKKNIGGDKFHFAMLNYEGESVHTRIYKEKGRRFSLSSAVNIIEQVAYALDHIHEKGFVHLDVKPSNILLKQGSGTAILADFGIARTLKEIQSLSHAPGTISYRAPETVALAKRSPKQLPPPDGRADVYALGLTLYEMLTGRQAKRKSDDPMPSLCANNLFCPKAVEKIICQATNPNPEKRYPTAGAFAADLRRAAQQSTLTRSLVAAFLALLLLAGVALIGMGQGWPPFPSPTPPAVVITQTVTVVVDASVTGNAGVALGNRLEATPSPTPSPSTPTPPTPTPSPTPSLPPHALKPTATLAPFKPVAAPSPTSTPTATPAPVSPSPTPVEKVESAPGGTLPPDLPGEDILLLSPTANQSFGGGPIEFRWRLAGRDECLSPPENHGFEVRVWPERNGVAPMGAMDARDQEKIACQQGIYSYTVSDIAMTAGVRNFSSDTIFRWDVAWVRLEKYQPLAWPLSVRLNISLGGGGGGGGTSPLPH